MMSHHPQTISACLEFLLLLSLAKESMTQRLIYSFIGFPLFKKPSLGNIGHLQMA
jgi:hypothetical protein